MAGADGDSPAAVLARLEQKAERMLDLTLPMNALSVHFAQLTAQSFQRRISPAGESWPELAQSTLRRRAAKLRGAKRRGKNGRLTAKARRTRSDALARERAASVPGGGFITGRVFAPLIDSGRMRQSISYVPRKTGIVISGVGYLAHHVGGDRKRKPPRPPKRNPLVVELGDDGAPQLIPVAHEALVRLVTVYINTGQVLRP